MNKGDRRKKNKRSYAMKIRCSNNKEEENKMKTKKMIRTRRRKITRTKREIRK